MVEVPKTESKPEDSGLQTLGGLPRESRAQLSVTTKFALAASLIPMIAGIVFFTTADHPQAPAAATTVEVGSPLQASLSGWIDDFTPPDGSQMRRFP